MYINDWVTIQDILLDPDKIIWRSWLDQDLSQIQDKSNLIIVIW